MDLPASSQTVSSSSPPIENQSLHPPEQDDVCSRARNFVDSLSVESLNLAVPDILTQVDWVQTGRSSTYMLVINHKEKEDDLYRPAILEFVGEISPSNFWLYPCGGWNGERGPSNSWSKISPFENARARARVRRSPFPFYSRLWPATIDNLRKIVVLGVTRANNTQKSIDYNVVSGNDIRIRHSVFFENEDSVQRSTDDDDDPEDDKEDADGASIQTDTEPETIPDPQFSTANMPCKYEPATKALQRIIEEGEHTFNPLVALDTNRRLIPPTLYERKLSGATVLVRVSLTCDSFPKGLQFYAEIESINVLCPPKPLVSLPPSASRSRKRKVNLANLLSMELKKLKRSSFEDEDDNEGIAPRA